MGVPPARAAPRHRRMHGWSGSWRRPRWGGANPLSTSCWRRPVTWAGRRPHLAVPLRPCPSPGAVSPVCAPPGSGGAPSQYGRRRAQAREIRPNSHKTGNKLDCNNRKRLNVSRPHRLSRTPWLGYVAQGCPERQVRSLAPPDGHCPESREPAVSGGGGVLGGPRGRLRARPRPALRPHAPSVPCGVPRASVRQPPIGKRH